MRRPPLLLLVALAGALPYLGVLDAPFLDLDDAYFLTNLSLWTDPGVSAAWEVIARPTFGAWHPLHQLSYLVDRLVWGQSAFGVRLDQALLHGACAAAVVSLARRLGLSAVAAAIAGLFFAWHPAHSENVCWISQRKDLLSCLFLVLGLRAWHAPPGQDGAPPWRSRVATLLLLALSLLSKSSGSVLAPMLLVSSCAGLGAGDAGRTAGARLRRDAGWLAAAFALGLGATAIHFVAQRDLGAVQAVAPARTAHARQLLLALDYYAVTAVAPVNLSMIPTNPGGESLGASDLRAAAVAVGLAAAVVLSWRRRRRAAAFVLWGLVALGPMIGLVPLPTFVQNRYLLVTTAALSLLAGDLVAGAGRARGAHPRQRLLLLAGALLVLGAWLSARAARPWTDVVSLWRHAVTVDPRNAYAAARLAEAMTKHAHERSDLVELAEAVRIARAALKLSPDHPMAHAALGAALSEQRELAEARVHLERVAASGWNGAHEAVIRLVLLDIDEGDHAAARLHLARAHQIAKPDQLASVEAQLALSEGRPADAATALRELVARTPTWAEAWGRLADAERLAGDVAAAERALARADPAQAAAVRAHLAVDAGRLDEAAALVAEAKAAGQPTLSGDVAAIRLAAARGSPDAVSLLAEAERRRGSILRRRAGLEPDLRALLGGP